MLVGLTGYARVGKDSVANYLVREHGFVRFSFADALRDLVAVIDPLLRYDPKPLSPGSGAVGVPLSQYVSEGRDDSWLKEHTDYRDYLKRLGNGAREIIDPDVWLDIVSEKILRSENPNVVVTDVRFPNEATMLRWQGGEIWRIIREGYGPESDFELASDAIDADYSFGAPDVPNLEKAVGILMTRDKVS